MVIQSMTESIVRHAVLSEPDPCHGITDAATTRLIASSMPNEPSQRKSLEKLSTCHESAYLARDEIFHRHRPYAAGDEFSSAEVRHYSTVGIEAGGTRPSSHRVPLTIFLRRRAQICTAYRTLLGRSFIPFPVFRCAREKSSSIKSLR